MAARKTAASKSNVEKLQAAGVLHSEHCSSAHQAAINKLSADEVSALIRVKKKVGTHLGSSAAAKKVGRPWCL
jgi:hypothetical protein